MKAVFVTMLCIFIIAFFVIFFAVSFIFGLDDKTKNILKTKTIKIIFAFFTTFGTILCVYMLRKNKFIYFWDYGGYWTSSYSLCELLFSNPREAIHSIYVSVLNSDYNLILPSVVALPLRVFGYTFERYVLINYFVFLVPTWFILFGLSLKVFYQVFPKWEINRKTCAVYIIIMMVIVTFNVFYLAMLQGYIDVACLIPVSLSMLLVLDYDAISINKKQLFRDILLSLNLLCAFLFRRYFAYYIVGFIIALMVLSLKQILTNRNTEKIIIIVRNAIVNLLIIGIIALAIMVVFFRQLLIHVLTNDFAGQYAGYNAPLVSKVKGVVFSYGLFCIIIILIGLISSLVAKKHRKIIFFSLIEVCFTAIGFFSLQSMGIHHLYVIAVPIFLLMLGGYMQC